MDDGVDLEISHEVWVWGWGWGDGKKACKEKSLKWNYHRSSNCRVETGLDMYQKKKTDPHPSSCPSVLALGD